MEVEEVSDFVLDSVAGAGVLADSDAAGFESGVGAALVESSFEVPLEDLLE